jgi:hypothetical protein
MNQELESWEGNVKYKEFWIAQHFYDNTIYDSVPDYGDFDYHVIEFQAYKDAQSEIERLKKELEANLAAKNDLAKDILILDEMTRSWKKMYEPGIRQIKRLFK